MGFPLRTGSEERVEMSEEALAAKIKWNGDGLVPAIVQHQRTGRVLMCAWMNAEALDATLATGLVHFWSRSRRVLWRKGETSGNVLRLADIVADCDGDTLLVAVLPAGPVCHTGNRTCFGDESPQGFYDLEYLWSTICERLASGREGSYTAQLASGGAAAVSRKIIEEAAETAGAALRHEAGRDGGERVAEEAADVIYHLLVLLAERGVPPQRVTEELAARRR